MRRFAVPQLQEGLLRLDPAASHHLLRVLRTPRGAPVGLRDEGGRVAEGRLVEVDGGVAVILAGPASAPPPPPRRELLLGLPKAALAEEAVQLGTEAGLQRIVGLRAERSPRPEPRADRLLRIAESAARQCGRPDLPELRLVDALPTALALFGEGARFVATPGAGGVSPVAGPAILAVGPEGGWSEGEQAQLEAAGFEPLGLGPWILRAPTAVAVGLGRLLPS